MSPSYNAQIVESTRANIDTASRIAAILKEGTERLFKLQTEALNVAFAENSKSFNSAAALAEWPSLYQANVRRIWEVTRGCFEIVSQTQAEIAPLMSEYFKAYNEGARQNLDQFTKAVNEGREAASAAVKDSLAKAGVDASGNQGAKKQKVV
jgi:Phasin protein